MILNTGLGDDLTDYSINPSPVIWIGGILVAGWIIGKILDPKYKPRKVQAYGWPSEGQRSRKGYKRLDKESKRTREIREFVEKSRRPVAKSKVLSKKETEGIFGDLF